LKDIGGSSPDVRLLNLVQLALDCLTPIPGPHSHEIRRDVHAIYSHDVLFALATRDALYFKADHRTLTRYLARGTHAFHPRPRQTLRSFYAVPPEILADPNLLLEWAQDAIDAAATHPGRLRRRFRKQRKPRSRRAKDAPAATIPRRPCAKE
jgi:TfoX/Sxy family transcriptional regulator of competence genes